MEDKKTPHKKGKMTSKFAHSLPIISGTFAAILTEGKTIKEMETIAVFLASLANDIYMIASVKSKNDIIDEIFDDDITGL